MRMLLGPDERTYLSHAEQWRVFGRDGLRAEAAAYLASASERDYPSPLRWGWALCLRLHERAAVGFALVCAALTLSVSPLLLHLARRRLQDTAVAAATLACMTSSYTGHTFALACAFAALCALKLEGAALALPAIAMAWPVPLSWQMLTPMGYNGALWWCAAGAVVYACATAFVFGPRLAWALVCAVAQPHDNAYGREHQRGMPHRLLVDFVLVSPVWVMAAAWLHPVSLAPAVALVIAHAFTPVRNVRTVLAADLWMRACVMVEAPWWVTAQAYLYDLQTVAHARKLALYDTPTAELVRVTCQREGA